MKRPLTIMTITAIRRTLCGRGGREGGREGERERERGRERQREGEMMNISLNHKVYTY